MTTKQGKTANAVRMRIAIFIVFLAASLAVLFSQELDAQKENVLEISAEELSQGALLKSGDKLFFVKDEKKAGDTFVYERDGERFVIRVTESKPYHGKNILIPVEITDKELAKGVDLTVVGENGQRIKVQVPRRRVFLPLKFHVIFHDLGEPGRNGGRNGALILEVHPKLTQDVRVNVNQTADTGIVIKIDYEDSLKTRFYDVLDQANKRDMSIQYEYKTSPREKWGISMRNILQAQNARIVDIWRVQKVKEDLYVEARLDNIQAKGAARLGANVLYYKKNMEVNAGNVDNKVEDEFHAQLKLNRKYGNVVFRLQDFHVNRKFDFTLPGFQPNKFGAQVNFTRLPYGAKLSLGNIKVERTFEDFETGKVDTEFNFLLEQEYDFGEQFPGMQNKFTWNASTRLRLVGVGPEVWLQGRFLSELHFASNFALQFEINDDFITLSGKPFHDPFQYRRLTLIRYRDFIEDHSVVGKLGLDYAFTEVVSRRANFADPFYKKAAYKAGIGKSFTILGLPLPLEIFGEKEFSRKNFSFGITASLRQWL